MIRIIAMPQKMDPDFSRRRRVLYVQLGERSVANDVFTCWQPVPAAFARHLPEVIDQLAGARVAPARPCPMAYEMRLVELRGVELLW